MSLAVARRSEQMEQHRPELWRNSSIVGAWFIKFGMDGKPLIAGRISRGVTGPGQRRYLPMYSFIRDGVKVLPVVTADYVADSQWLLFDRQGAWRSAFVQAENK
jgi:hypothetical protein